MSLFSFVLFEQKSAPLTASTRVRLRTADPCPRIGNREAGVFTVSGART